ncbi:diguanylate cyclase domain-containing protein, partial [Lactobacillus sp.]|uniref:diguanylate cyclase domain-containing protein n=1 Tax=Lactobacillus sp. TaxID=1591 RepID=UPI003F0D201B
LYDFSEDARETYERSPFPILIYQLIGGQYKVILLSDGYCQMVQSDRESMLGYLNQRSFNRIHPDDRNRLLAYSRKMGQQASGQMTYRLSIGGHYHQLLAYCKSQITKTGQKLLVVHYFDLTTGGSDLIDSLDPYLKAPKKHDLIDGLTGLANMTNFNESGGHYLREIIKDRGQAAVVILDIKNMHVYNNRFGYLKGDAFLCQLATLLKKEFPDAHLVRYFQDQFVIITDSSQIDNQLVKLNLKVKALSEGHLATIHCGIYLADEANELALAAVDKARFALFASSNSNRVCNYYTAKVQEKVDKRDYILGHFSEALQKGWINSDVQPVINLMNHKIAAFELLARWKDPVYGTMYPEDFLPVLEESQLSHLLDLHILEEACKIYACRRKQDLQIVPLVINLSTDDLENELFLKEVNRLMQKYQLPHSQLIFDLAVSSACKPETIKQLLAALEDNHYACAFDCASSSYPTTNFLTHYSFEFMKFDLLSLNPVRSKEAAVLSNLLSACKQLGIRPIFKNVENKLQLDFLKSVGAVLVQGNCLFPATPFKDSLKLLGQKGYSAQGHEEQTFYQEINQIDLLDPAYRFFDHKKPGLGSSAPVAVYLIDGNQVRLAYLNPPAQDWVAKVNGTEKDYVNELELGQDSNSLRFWDAVKSCSEIGDSSSYVLTGPHFHYRILLQLVAENGTTKAFLSTMDGQPVRNPVFLDKDKGKIKTDNLWDAITQQIKLGLFWKDKERNFMGANQHFLNYYGLSLPEVIGHNDNELGLNIHPENFQESEEQLLRDGVPIRELGKTLARGRVREILVFKAPVYDKGQIVGLLGFFTDVTNTSKRINQLEHEAARDDLTSLKNRHNFARDFNYLTGKPILVMMLDVDHFKKFNDNFGHLYGDEVLKKLSQLLLKIYGIGHCYRYGGDEFLILRDFTDIDTVEKQDRQLRIELEHVQILDLYMNITVSAGYTYGIAHNSDEIKSMIRLADHNLYQVKKNGRKGSCGSPYKPAYY